MKNQIEALSEARKPFILGTYMPCYHPYLDEPETHVEAAVNEALAVDEEAAPDSFPRGSQLEFGALKSLRSKGYAVVVFDSEELAGATPRLLEDALVEQAWDIINELKPS